MATRLFLLSQASAGVAGSSPALPFTPAWSASWNKSTSTSVGLATVGIYNTNGATNPSSAASGTSGHYTAAMRFISPPLKAQTISGTIKGQLLCHQTNTTDNYTVAVSIKVVTAADALVGTLLSPTASDDVTATPPEMSTVYTNRRFLDSSESASITISDVTCSDGDYLVIETGFRQASTAVASGFGFSGPANSTFSAIPEDDTSTSGVSWLEFSDNIEFKSATYFYSASTPADGTGTGTGTADPTAVTPPTGMQAGDLVFLIADARVASLTQAISQAGGQTWTSHAQQSATTKSVRVFTCTFNGTWSANPSVSFGSTTCNSAYMHVFRPPSTSYTWSVNVAQTSTNDTTDPFSALTGHTTTGTNPTVTLQGWHSPDDNTWGSQTGTGWEVTGTAQYRNTSGSDQSASFAHIFSTTAQTLATAGKSQLTLGADNTQIWEITMEAVAPAGGAMVGSTNPRFTPTGVLGGSGALSASRTVTFSPTGVIQGQAPIVGAVSGFAFTTSAVASANVSISGLSSPIF